MQNVAWSFVVGAGLLLAACSDGTAPSGTPSLTIKGATHAPSAGFRTGSLSARTASFAVAPSDTMSDPSAVRVGMYALWISQNADCSNAVLVQDNGDTAQYKDFVGNPTLFSGTPAAGSYKCLVFKMSDVIKFESATTFAQCAASTEYAIDIYRSDNSADPSSVFKDVDLNPIAASGSDSMPVDNHVAIVMTRDTSAAIARGFSTNQVIQLGSDLVVPGSSTFVWGGTGTVRSDTGRPCGLEPGSPSFQ
jgi:hypothetical protein